MSLACGALFLKYLLCIFNFIFVLTGIILVVVGSVIQGLYTEYDPLLDESFFSVPVLLIVIGAIVFVVSFFGCCGAYKENYCLTISFVVSLILIFILELSGGIAGYLLRDRVLDIVNKEMDVSMKFYDNSTQYKVMWDEIQTSLKCCGDTSPKRWIEIRNKLPESCCEKMIDECTLDQAYKACKNGLISLLQNYAGILGGVAVAIAIIQLLGIIFACNLASSFRDYESV